MRTAIKLRLFSIHLVLLSLLIALVGCEGQPQIGTSPSVETTPNTQTDAERTLASLRRLSPDAPLYEMHYYGDYGFDEHIQLTHKPNHYLRLPQPDFACSCFAAQGDPQARLFGRNFDWHRHPALVLFTDPPDGYASISMVDIYYLNYDGQRDPLDDPGDLLDAPFLPLDGMNDQGMAVSLLAVPHAKGGNDPQKATLDDLELIRLLLDQARDVPEALELMSDYNVDFGSVPVHYLIADAAGNSAVVEYLDGQPVAVESDQPWQVATNFLVSEEKSQGADSPCPRYNRLYAGLQQAGGKIDMQQGMTMLQSVAQGGEHPTRWSWVFDLSRQTARLSFEKDYQNVYEFSLGE